MFVRNVLYFLREKKKKRIKKLTLFPEKKKKSLVPRDVEVLSLL